MREILRIAFVRTDRMGDVLMNLPAVRLLRQTFPKSWITLVVDRSVTDLLTGHPDVDEVLPLDAARFKASLGYRWRLSRVFKRAAFDLAVVSNPDKWMHAVVFAAGIPYRVGWDRKWAFFLTKRFPAGGAARHEMDRNLELASLASDKTWDGKLALPVDDVARREVAARIERDFAGKAGIIAIHTGTSNPKKRWPAECFAELAARVGPRPVLLLGGPEEAGAAKTVAARVPTAVDWTGKTSLKELTALFSSGRVAALVSADSGPVHIAWIAGTPVVSLYAADVPGSEPRRWGPRDPKSRVIHKPVAAIGVDEVAAALSQAAE